MYDLSLRLTLTEAVEAANHNQIIPFHHERRGGEYTPADSLRVGTNRLEDAHLVFMVGGLLGFVDDALKVGLGAPSFIRILELGHAAIHGGNRAILGHDGGLSVSHGVCSVWVALGG